MGKKNKKKNPQLPTNKNPQEKLCNSLCTFTVLKRCYVVCDYTTNKMVNQDTYV